MTKPRTERTSLIRRHARSTVRGTVTGGVFTKTWGRASRPDYRRYPSDGVGPEADLGEGGTEPNPRINFLTPNTGSAAAGAILVTVDGFGFTPSSVIEIDQVAVPTTYVNGGRLTTSYDPSTTGVKQFTVRDGEGESNSAAFTVGAEDDPVTNPAGWTIPDIKEWVDANPTWADEVLAAEQARGDDARQTLIAWLEGFIEHRDE